MDRLVTLCFSDAVEGAFAVLGSKRLGRSVLGASAGKAGEKREGNAAPISFIVVRLNVSRLLSARAHVQRKD